MSRIGRAREILTGFVGLSFAISALLVLSACAEVLTTAPVAERPTEAIVQPETTVPELQTLNVFAAASLQDALEEIGAAFAEANPEAKPQFNFAGSQQLAAQIKAGAPVDVFASANNTQMQSVIDAGEVVSGTQVPFARNRLIVVIPADNTAGIETLEDLATPGHKIVLASKEVPVGNYALQFLENASAQPGFTDAYSASVLSNVVSFEDDVKGVLRKVALGEADAGIVYSSDVTSAVADLVTTLAIPDDLNVIATYPIATIARSEHPDLADAFIQFVVSQKGQEILAKHGFIRLEGS